MNFKEVMELPASTDNTTVYNELYKTVTPEDIFSGTNPRLFSHAYLIEWAVRNKKYEEYYAFMKQHKNDSTKDLENLENNLIKDKTVFVRFSVAGEPLFGFLSDYDGESALMFPGKKEMMCVFL